MFPKNRKTWANKSSIYTVTPSTYQTTTLYVTATGNDANNGLSAAQALATIQEAVNRIPKYIKHNTIINVGAGTFSPFSLDGFVQESGYLQITGTLGAPTLATGTASGTSTGGSTTTLIDATQTWTVNDLVGYLLVVAGEYAVILSNTANTITCVGQFSATTSGKAYTIREQKTVISGQTAYSKTSDGTSINASILIRNSKFNDCFVENIKISPTQNSAYGLYLVDTNRFVFKQNYMNGFTNASSYQYGVYVRNCFDCGFLDNYATNTYYGYATEGCLQIMFVGIYAQSNYTGFVFGQSNLPDCYRLMATDNTEGFTISGKNTHVYILSLNSSSNTGNGINLYGNLLLDDAQVMSNSYGIVIGETTNNFIGTLEIIGASSIGNNTNDGIVGYDSAIINARYAGGTGNGGYGVRCKNKNILMLSNGNTTITGASGTYTLDDGDNAAADWTTNFSSNGDSVYELTTSTLAVRRD